MKYCWPALIILPDLVNSRLLRCTQLVLLAVLCTRIEFVKDPWRGRQSSESAAEMLVSYNADCIELSSVVVPRSENAEKSAWPKTAATMTRIRYLRIFLILQSKYTQISCIFNRKYSFWVDFWVDGKEKEVVNY